jgi:hypothetical protein
MKRQNRRLKAVLIATILLLISSFVLLSAAAQTLDNDWIEPVNLSQAGSASEPRIVVDSNNQFHVFWQDEFAGVVYTQGDGTEWSEPRALEFPFGDELRPVEITADRSGFLHAFWLDANSDLVHSFVTASNAANPFNWTQPFTLADNVGNMESNVAPGGRIHISYVKTGEGDGTPAGIYHRFFDTTTFVWSPTRLLDQSPYFRGLLPEQARIQMASGSEGSVYIAWDNRPLERVYLTRSADSGATWSDVIEMDRRSEEDSIDATGPSRVILHARGRQAMFLWDAGHDEARCSQYFMASTDWGETWTERLQIIEAFPSCPSASQIVNGPSGSIILLTNQPIGVFLTAWDGQNWSTPQLQTPLTGFVNTETFRDVLLGCHQLLNHENVLYVLGCDGGGGEDIWLTQRELGAVDEWYPTPTPTSVWNPEFSLMDDGRERGDARLLIDGQGDVYAFWTEFGGQSISHARRTGGFGEPPQISWSNSVPIFEAAGGKVEQVDVIGVQDTGLLAVWNANSGSLKFSTAEAAFSLITARWANPTDIPVPRSGINSPSIGVDGQRNIYVVYSLPVNQQRGIYLNTSEDRGQTWSEPIRIFDAERENWEIADEAQLAVSPSGVLHVLWKQLTFSGGTGQEPAALSLFYSRSEDGGLTWSTPETVAPTAPLSSTILVQGDRSVFRLWSVESNSRPTLSFNYSLDGGLTWSSVERVSELGNETIYYSLVTDRNGIINLLQVRRDFSSEFADQDYLLQRYAWEGQRWGVRETVNLGAEPIEALAASVGPDNSLSVVYVQTRFDEDGEIQGSQFNFIDRLLAPPALEPTPLPELTPTPTLAVDSGSDPEIQPSPTVHFPTAPSTDPLIDLFGSSGGLVIGLLAATVVMIVLIIIGRALNKRR